MCSEGVRRSCVIAPCGYMHRGNRCVYMVHVCFYVCCSDCMGSVRMSVV